MKPFAFHLAPAAHLASRFRLLLLLGTVAFGARCGREVPAERTFAALLETVERATGVLPDAAAWEPSRGKFVDLTVGRPLLVNGRTESAAPGDIYRVFVRVAPDGAPLDVVRSYNLSNTELAEERALLVRGPLAAFATVAFDRVQGITVLDGRGTYRGSTSGLAGLIHRAELVVDSLLETGTWKGLGRTDIELVQPLAELELELTPGQLDLIVGDRRWQLQLNEAGLALVPPAGDAEAERPALDVLPRIAQQKPVLHWMADTGRTLLGTGAIAWLEGRAFAVIDRWRRWSYSLFGGAADEESVPEPPRQVVGAPASSEAATWEHEVAWPPPDITPLWKAPQPDEGLWKPVDLPLVRRKIPDDDLSPFFRTFIRPDRERPYANVLLVAMDMRRLELGMEGGYEDPRPSAGPPGAGHVPSDPRVYRRILATFNGAFKSTHGGYGMVVNRRVLVPPVPGAATVRVDRSGAVGLGSWPRTASVDSQAGTPELPADLVSLRQNLDALIEGTTLNPRGRKVWGSQLYGQGVAAERSAMCVTRGGHLLYAWGEETSGETLAEALRMADCEYGIHLDMNPGHCAFVFTDIVDFERVEAETQVLDPRMRVNPKRYIRWSPKDFFYVTLREPLPRGQELEWGPDAGTQPAPSWIPSVLRTTQRLGTLEVDVLRFDTERIRWTARPGSGEPGRPEAAELPSHVLAAIGMGHATAAANHGLAFGHQQIVPLNPAFATLSLSPDGTARLDPPGTPLLGEDGRILVQLPLLAQDGELMPRARQPGSLRERGALCLDEQGNLLLARITHDTTGPAAVALQRLGCGLIVEADRGSQHPPFVERAGVDTPSRAAHETSVLYGATRPLRPRGYWWRPEASPATP